MRRTGTGLIESPIARRKGNRQSLTDMEFWDSFWKDYVPGPFPSEHERQYGSEGYFLRMMDSVGIRQGQSVIELGGALSFRLLALAKRRSMRATAVDYAAAALAASAKWFMDNDCELEAIQGDFYDLPSDRGFDLVTHWGVLEHEIDPTTLIRLCARLMNPGGILVFSMPNMKGPGAWLWTRWSPIGWTKHIYHSDESIRSAANKAGLDCESFGHGAPFLYISPCETSGVLPRVALLMQKGLDRLGQARMWSFIAQHRVFVCRPSSVGSPNAFHSEVHS